MFKVESERLVKQWPAIIELPIDGGKIHKEPIKLDLLILDTEENAKLLRGDEATALKILKGWSGVADEHGDALPFNNDTAKLVLKNQFFVIGLIRAYQQASNGQAAEKN